MAFSHLDLVASVPEENLLENVQKLTLNQMEIVDKNETVKVKLNDRIQTVRNTARRRMLF